MTDGMTAADTLRALADDWEDRSCGLYVHLRDGAGERWGVNCFRQGSVAVVLREIADAADEEQKALRAFSERVHGMLWGDGWHPLDEIADRLEEELSELDRTRCHEPEEPEELDDGGCYDGMVHPVDDEDYEAAVWVRGHGGLDAVRERLGERKRLVDRLHAYEDALDMMADSMGVEKSSDKIAQARRTRKAVKSLECRLIPDGVKWPRFEDGEPVRIGDEFECWCGETHTVESVTIREGRSALNASKLHMFVVSDGPFTAHGKRVKRPAVLASDGEPLEVGQTVWDEHGDELQVLSIEDDHERHVTCHYEGVDGIKANGWWLPRELTHQRPVLDADGVPIKKGDTVYEDGEKYTPFTVLRLPTDQYRLVKVEYPNGSFTYLDPERITHTKPDHPDSWERIEEDARAMLDDGLHPNGEWVLDLLGRAKALAERGA